jgi:hypothetical protein
MNNLPNKQTNPVIAGCLTLIVLAIMVGSVSALHSHEAAAKQSKIAHNNNPTPAPIASEPSGTPKLSPTNVTTTPANTPVPTTNTTPATTPSKSTASTPSPTPTPTPSPSPTPSPTPTPPPTPTYTYKDGNYSAIGTFTAPGVTNHLNVSVTIAKDVITSSSVTVPSGTDPTSTNYDNNFIANYKPYVTGKSLATLTLSKIASASLTPNGFNNALAQIRTAAHS